jgi:alpha-amylase
VLNHTSDQHPWFVEARDDPTSARRGWYIWSQSLPSYAGPWGEQVWFPSLTGYYYGVFGADMPDLNYTNPQVTAEMDKVARFWLEDLGADGFRLDAARYLIEEGTSQADTVSTHAWWKQFRAVYKAVNPQAVTVGEVASTRYAIAEYVQGDELDLAFDFPLEEALVKGVNARNAGILQAAITESYNQFGSNRSATFLSNHDMNRMMSRIAGQADKAKLAAMLLLTVPGVPFIYYGEEIGMTGAKPDPNIRTPMQWSAEKNAGFSAGSPWEAVNADYGEVNVAAQLQDPASLLSCYRNMIHLRLAHPALQSGDYTPVDTGNKTLLAFLRSSPEETLLVVINLGAKPASGYALTLNTGNLSGTFQASLVYGGKAELPNLSANEAGGFNSYQPSFEIPGSDMVVIQLQAVK